jgi:hypothetical protein
MNELPTIEYLNYQTLHERFGVLHVWDTLLIKCKTCKHTILYDGLLNHLICDFKFDDNTITCSNNDMYDVSCCQGYELK